VILQRGFQKLLDADDPALTDQNSRTLPNQRNNESKLIQVAA
jgi:hypothetical protein